MSRSAYSRSVELAEDRLPDGSRYIGKSNTCLAVTRYCLLSTRTMKSVPEPLWDRQHIEVPQSSSAFTSVSRSHGLRLCRFRAGVRERLLTAINRRSTSPAERQD